MHIDFDNRKTRHGFDGFFDVLLSRKSNVGDSCAVFDDDKQVDRRFAFADFNFDAFGEIFATEHFGNAADYAARKDAFIKAYRDAIPAEKRATTCVDCGQCLPKCPQSIRIPNQMSRLVELARKRRG